jgi:hypothetical protein
MMAAAVKSLETEAIMYTCFQGRFDSVLLVGVIED